jgi:lysophospholipase L1-like esterase
VASGSDKSNPNTPGKTWRSPHFWDKDIASFKQMDDQNMPPKNSMLFVGSSSIRMWDLKKYFSGINTINRGFGGSYLSESVYFADKIVLPYKPSLIVLYAGDNDVTDDKSPARVAADFNEFVKTVRKSLPQTPIIYISIKPSVARWKLWPNMKKSNDLIKTEIAKYDKVKFLNISNDMLGPDNKPDPKYFLKDGLHLSHEGYKLWTNKIRPLINGDFK